MLKIALRTLLIICCTAVPTAGYENKGSGRIEAFTERWTDIDLAAAKMSLVPDLMEAPFAMAEQGS